jgi:ATP-dependent Clp protease protease subunit
MEKTMIDYNPLRYDDEDKDGEDKDDDKEDKQSGGMMAKLLKSRTIIFSKQVDDKMAASAFAQLRILEDDDPDKPITLIVNSPGGSADSGFAIRDYARFVKPPIRSIVCGICASAAVMIHLAADKDNRFCTPSSRFLLHQPSMSGRGQASDLEILSTEIDRIKKHYNDIVAEETKRTFKQIEKDVHRDFWIPAENAVDYGLVAKVVASRKEME